MTLMRFSAFALLGLAAGAAFLVPQTADAQRSRADEAEWSQAYDAITSGNDVVRVGATPTLSAATVANTERAVQQYTSIVAAGGWPKVPADTRLKLGASGERVVLVRQRLIASGDLDPSVGGQATIFDSYVESAVKRFQARHGLSDTGYVGPQTVAAMNIPADVRLRQLETNLVRLRTMSGPLGERFAMVNIPAAEIETVEQGQVHSRHFAVVGKIDRQSPVMNARITEVNFNPFWTVPASIIRKDLIPKMQQDPEYLTTNKIRIYDKAGNEVSPRSINWNSMEATNYRFRQDPGDLNSMGSIRINVPNVHGVYMHDTPSKSLFGQDFRFHSSGCVRVQNVREFVSWLLAPNGLNREQVEDYFNSPDRRDVGLKQVTPVYWVYITAWSNADGIVQFRDDIYNKDGLGAATQSLSQEPI